VIEITESEQTDDGAKMAFSKEAACLSAAHTDGGPGLRLSIALFPVNLL
jgi:hypothetical protein